MSKKKIESLDDKKDNLKKSNNILKTIIIFLLFVVLILSIVLVVLVIRGGSKVETPEMEIINDSSEKVKKDIDELKEKDITDSVIKKSLSDRIDILLSNSTSDELNRIYSGYRFRTGVLTRKLTEEDMLYIVLHNIKFDNIKDDNWENVSYIKSMVESEVSNSNITMYQVLSEYGELSFDDVNNNYTSMFGKGIKNTYDKISKCPTYVYDSNGKRFYSTPSRCGGASGSAFYAYKSRFVENGDDFYVYVSLGLQEDGKIYTDYEFTDDSLEGNYKAIKEYSGDIDIINNDNYKEFPEYKFSFKLGNDGEYYFVSVEQTNS